jgi:serine/threonine protein kinase
MSSGRRDDLPDPAVGSVPGAPEDDGLLTSEDLFGDLVDSAPESGESDSGPPRKPPVRVQVPEPGAARRPDRVHMPRDMRPEEMAALLDAFSGPSEAALADVPPPTLAPPAPGADPAEGLLADLPGEPAEFAPPAEVEADPLLGVLGVDLESEPGTLDPSPALDVFAGEAEPGSAEPIEDMDALLAPPPAEALEPELEPESFSLEDLAPEPMAAEAPRAEPEAEPVLDLDAPLILEGEVESPQLVSQDEEEEDLLADVLVPEEEPEAPRPTPTQPFMDVSGLEDLLAAAGAVEPVRPTSRTGTKFQAAGPRKAVPVEGGLDLASLAEDAFRVAEQEAKAPAGEKQGAERFREDVYGPYTLLERVAVGGMAEVFRAKRSGVEGFEKIVAVKRILPHLSDNKEFVDMFIDEAKMVAGLTHPNIVQIFDLGRIDKTYYIAMEHISGKDLRTILRCARERGLRLPLDLSVLVVSRVCAALEYAHRARDDQGRAMRIVHRDISPQNILISFEGDVKLTDFGIAKAATKATATDAGALRGKLLYMSPEQAWGKPMDRRSDVFSLGIVFYEMVTDQKPFLGTSEMSILETVRECRISPPSSFNPRLPEKIEKVILKALERDPDDRYQDAAEMARDLERVLRERQPPTPVELARYMEILFDQATPGGGPHEDGQRQEDPERGLEIELDTDVPAPEKTGPGAQEPDQKSIQKLLKRFGIK